MDKESQATPRRSATSAEVEAALERIVESPSFARARRAQDFLRFVTRETLAGRAHELNGYRIALAVFGKPVDFDPANDPLVRVEAKRLRARLCEYYATLGSDDPVRIEMKPGGYVPTFEFVGPLAADTTQGRASSRSAWSRMSWLGLPAAGLVVVAWAVGGVHSATNTVGPSSAVSERATAARPHTGPRIRIESFEPAEPSETAPLALGLTEEIMTRLGRYRDLRVLVPIGGDGTPRDVGEDFVLSGAVSTANDAIRISPRLVDARSGREIWRAAYERPLAADSVWEIVDSVAGAVAAAVGEPYGPLFDAEVSRTSLATESDPYHCLLRFVFALQVISEDAHGRATSCFEKAVAADPHSSMSWARLAALYRMEYLHAFNVEPDAPPALDRAEAAVQRALAADERNAFAHQEMAFLCLLRDDRAGFEQSVARALELDPPADIRAALGINFVKMGEVERGLALIDEGIAESPRAPPFFFLGYVVQALRVHDYAAAYASAERMATRDWPLSQAFLAAAAALDGKRERAEQAAQRLLELQPEFARTGRDLVARGRLGAEVESELLRGLAFAGVAVD